MAETRAVNRALRKAYGIGLCSVEELGSFSAPQMPLRPGRVRMVMPDQTDRSNGQPRLRDQLCLLIRQHDLDPTLVKAYAADFCGTATLKDASRDLVESFITQLATAAKKDRDGTRLQIEFLLSTCGGKTMKRHIPGLHSRQQDHENLLEGLFLVRVDAASYRWHPQKPFLSIRFVVLEPEALAGRSFSGRLYCTERALWKLNWFLRDFGYDSDLLNQDQIDEKALLKLRGVVRTSYVTLNGRSFQNLEAFAPETEWEELSCETVGGKQGLGSGDDLSHTQISQYLRCPRSYRHRYLDGWREKETRAAMAFGRCFEKALAAYFSGEDCTAALFKEWGAFRDAPFEYKKGESWDRLVHQGVHLLQRFAQDDRVKIRRPEQDLQVKMVRSLPATTNSSLISTPSANSTVRNVSSIGKPRRAAIPRSLLDFYRSTRR